jgi:acyl-CoA reductase-like NAD-dependent aldehyde dehydrogenase
MSDRNQTTLDSDTAMDAVHAAVAAARKAQPIWAELDSMQRGRLMLALAKAMEANRNELATAIRSADRKTTLAQARKVVDGCLRRLICFAGWADKYALLLGGANPVAGPYHCVTIPEPAGVVGVIAPDEPALLGIISLVAPALCAGNAVIVVAGESQAKLCAALAESCAASDLPSGVLDLLAGGVDDLLEALAEDTEIDVIVGANLTAQQAAMLREEESLDVKRLRILNRPSASWEDRSVCESPWAIEPFVESKTIWHPSAT